MAGNTSTPGARSSRAPSRCSSPSTSGTDASASPISPGGPTYRSRPRTGSRVSWSREARSYAEPTATTSSAGGCGTSGLLAPVQTGLRQVASPFLNDIHAATLATVHLAVRERAQVLYVERLSGRTSVPVVSRVGSRLPMHSTGVGKVLLAHAPDRGSGTGADDLTRASRRTR